MSDNSRKNEQIILARAAAALDAQLTPEQTKKLLKLKELVLGWNEAFRLTAITDDEEFITKHLVDCITLIDFLPEQGRLLDIGSGAGFPGLVIAILKNDLDVSLAEASAKKCTFLNEAIKVLELMRAEALNIKIDEKSVPKNLAGRFDIVSSRAALKTTEIVRAAKKLCKKDGRIILMKGPKFIDEELDAVKDYLKQEGLEVAKLKSLKLPGSDIKRNIIVLKFSRNNSN